MDLHLTRSIKYPDIVSGYIFYIWQRNQMINLLQIILSKKSKTHHLATKQIFAVTLENIFHSQKGQGETLDVLFLLNIEIVITNQEDWGSEQLWESFLQLDSHLHSLCGSMFCKGRLLHGGSIWGWLIALSCQWCAQNSGILCICKY